MKGYMKNLVMGFLLWLVAHAVIAAAPERVLWDKRPIQVQLQVNQERIIHFPDEVRYWLPDSIKHKVSVLSANGVIYLRAMEHFARTRIRIQGLNDQQIYLLDVTANDIASTSDELIVMVHDKILNKSKPSSAQAAIEDWRVKLTRYAAQQLYAPERLLTGDSAIKRQPLDMSYPIPLIRGGAIKALPIASWQANGLTVTAIKLRNLTSQPLQIGFDNPNLPHGLNLSRLIRGNWLTATLQHSDLGPAEQDNDTTTLYLVSQRPFVESLNLVTPTTISSKDSNDG